LDALDDTAGIWAQQRTADAICVQLGHAQYLVTQRRAHYPITIKHDQPSLHAQLAALPWRQVPVTDQARQRGHGRAERRILRSHRRRCRAGLPHSAQAIQTVRRRRPLNSKKWSTETVYAITSLTAIQPRPAELAAIIRGRWCIEDSLHWVRDVTYDEDRSQIRTRNGPRVMASLRNPATPSCV
jgi:predicted transposase YbfD/YdcC